MSAAIQPRNCLLFEAGHSAQVRPELPTSCGTVAVQPDVFREQLSIPCTEKRVWLQQLEEAEMLPFLNEEQVRAEIRMVDLIPAMRTALIESSAGRVSQPAPDAFRRTAWRVLRYHADRGMARQRRA